MLYKILIWLIRGHPYTPTLIYFKKILNFLIFQTSKLPNAMAKREKICHNCPALYILRNFTHMPKTFGCFALRPCLPCAMCIHWVGVGGAHPTEGLLHPAHPTEGGLDTKAKPPTSFQAYSCLPSSHQVPQQVLPILRITSTFRMDYNWNHIKD